MSGLFIVSGAVPGAFCSAYVPPDRYNLSKHRPTGHSGGDVLVTNAEKVVRRTIEMTNVVDQKKLTGTQSAAEASSQPQSIVQRSNVTVHARYSHTPTPFWEEAEYFRTPVTHEGSYIDSTSVAPTANNSSPDESSVESESSTEGVKDYW